jgi:hypothetical protein
MPPTTELEHEIQIALNEIAIARDAAAAPLRFNPAAAAASDEQSRGQFEANLPQIDGGFATVRDGLLAASALFGATAKALAQFQDVRATDISVEQMELAREFAEAACRLKLAQRHGVRPSDAGVREGLVCA